MSIESNMGDARTKDEPEVRFARPSGRMDALHAVDQGSVPG